MNNTSFKLFNFFFFGWIFCCLWISLKKDFFCVSIFAVFDCVIFFFLLRIANFGTKIRYYDFLCVIFFSVTVHSLSFNTFIVFLSLIFVGLWPSDSDPEASSRNYRKMWKEIGKSLWDPSGGKKCAKFHLERGWGRSKCRPRLIFH